MSTSPLTPDVLRALPKVELHVHLEGTLSARRIAELADLSDTPLPRPVDDLFHFEGFDQFLDFLTWTCGLITTPEALSAVAYDYARFASESGIVYAEVIINPTHWKRWTVTDLVAGIGEGFRAARRDGLCDCRLLLSILRQQSTEEANDLARWIVEHPNDVVVGMSIDGNERAAGRVSSRFVEAYRLVGEAGLGLTAHAGESSGPEGVRDALDLLGVDRIDHGVRAIEDPELVARLADENVTLNVCLSSNLIHLYPDLDAHPLMALHRAGVPTTVNTDDPGFIQTDLVKEFAMAAQLGQWTIEDAAAASRRAITAAFCDDATRHRLSANLDDAVRNLAL